MIKLHAGEIKLVDVKTLKPRPGNRNNHPEEQLKRLADVYKYQGFRNPLIISNQSGNIVCGTGRFLAAKKAGLEKVPVIYQDYESEEQEYAHHVADNGLSLWSELDLAGINADLPDLGPDFDINMLGIEDFTLDMADKEVKNTGGELNIDQFDNFTHHCPKCGFEWNGDSKSFSEDIDE